MKKSILYPFALVVFGLMILSTGCNSSDEKENKGETTVSSGQVDPSDSAGNENEPKPVYCERSLPPAQPYDPETPAYEKLSEGFAHINSGDFEAALASYEEAVEVDSTDPAGYYGMAFSYSNLEMNLDAIYYYSMVIQLDSTYRKAYYNRAFEAMGLQQYMDAKKDLDRALELDPTDPDAWLNRGICKYSLGDEPGACTDWNRVCPEMREGIVDVYYKESCN